MPGLFSRIKIWSSTEDVAYSDINAEFDNVLTNFVPLMMDDYSTNAVQMQVMTDPGEVGSESLATTLAGELARLRFMIKEITGESYWYTSSSTSLAGLANAVGTGLTDNRIVSGRVRTASAQPIFLVPNGAARTVKLDGTPTNFIYYIEGIEYTISSDVTITNLTAAPSSNNTCLVNDAIAADQYWTKYSGEDGSEITIDTVGSEISALVGKLAGFKLDNGSTTEYFMAEVGTNKLIKARRGYFFDSSDNPIPRIVFSNNDTITLMKLTWVFAKSDGTITVTYTNPIWSDDEPSSPAANDYWFDTSTNKWKKYDVSSFVDADATLVGVCLQDTTNTVAARSFDFFANYQDTNTIELFFEGNAQLKSRHPSSLINVYGTSQKFEQGTITWDMTLDLESGVSENSSTYYYFYVTETGDKVISDKKPYDRREDLLGFYHPSHSWRCVGSAFNNGSSNLTEVNSYFSRYNAMPILPAQTAAMNIEVIPRVIKLDTSGGAFTEYLPPLAYWRGQSLHFVKSSSDLSIATLDLFGSEAFLGGATTTTLATQGEMLELFSDGSFAYVKNRNVPSKWTSYTPTFSAGFGTVTNAAGFWKRIGDSLLVRFSCTAGTVAASIASVSLPSGLSIDSSKLRFTSNTTSGSGDMVGKSYTAQSGATPNTNILTAPGTSTSVVYFSYQDNNATDKTVATDGNNMVASSTVFGGEFLVPITNWAE